MSAEEKTPQSSPEPQFLFPDLTGKSGTCLVDEAHGTFWLGINLRATDYLEAQAILDNSKISLFQWYRRAQLAAANKIIRPMQMAKDAAAQTSAFLREKFRH